MAFPHSSRGQGPAHAHAVTCCCAGWRMVFYEWEVPCAVSPTLQGVCGKEDNGTPAAPGNRGYLRTQDLCACISVLPVLEGFEGWGMRLLGVAWGCNVNQTWFTAFLTPGTGWPCWWPCSVWASSLLSCCRCMLRTALVPPCLYICPSLGLQPSGNSQNSWLLFPLLLGVALCLWKMLNASSTASGLGKAVQLLPLRALVLIP